jgi:hypothetical protein
MLYNKRARGLIIVLGLACAVVLALMLATRGTAVQTFSLQNAQAFSTFVYGGGDVLKTLPLNTPVSISISGMSATTGGMATIVACCDGVAWSWIGCKGDGTIAKGNNVATVGTVMCDTKAGHTVKVNNVSGQIRISVASGSSAGRIYVNY